MNEQLQAQLAQILALIHSAAKTSGDFAVAQLPGVAQTYLMYGRVSSVLRLLLFAGLAVYFGWVVWLGILENRKAILRQEFVLAVAAPAFVASTILLFVSANQVLLVWLAPKVWLLKEFAGLLK